MEYIINDTSNNDITHLHSRGLILPYGHSVDGDNYEGTADPFPDELLVPESEWQPRIEEMVERKTLLSDLTVDVPSKDQNGYNHCWAFAPVYCCEVVRFVETNQYADFSALSISGPIKNFQNVGGWGLEALQKIANDGINYAKDWPNNQLDRRYYTAENIERAKKNRVVQWWELKPRNLKQLVSLLLRRIPVAGGYNWWGHEVSIIDPVWLDGTIATRIRNQWWPNGVPWGKNNYSILQGSKMLADDMVAPRVMVAA